MLLCWIYLSYCEETKWIDLWSTYVLEVWSAGKFCCLFLQITTM